MKSYILDLPAVEAIQYDGSEEAEQQIRNVIEDEILIMRDIKGISGEFYPCKSDIFHKTYEEVE